MVDGKGTTAKRKVAAGLGAWWMLAVLFLLYMVSIVDRYIVYMIAPDIKQSLALSDGEMGLILGPAFSVFYALFGVPFGWCADRFSRRWIIFVGCLIFGFASMGGGLAGGFLLLFIARAIVGAGEASLSPSAYSLMGDRFERSQLTTASAVYISAANFGHAIAYGVGGVMLAFAGHVTFGGVHVAEPWRLVLICAGAPAILLAFLVFTFADPGRGKSVAPGARDETKVIDYLRGDGRLHLSLLAAFALTGICGTALTAWTPTYLSRQFGLSPAVYGPVLGAIGLVAGFSLVVKGAIVDWFFKRGVKDIHIRFYTWLLLPSIPLAVIMWLVNDVIVFMVIYGVLQIVTLTMLAFLAPVVQLLSPPKLRGRLMATFLVVYSVVGAGLGPPMAGWLTDHAFRDESKLGYSVMTLMAVILPITFVMLRRTLKRIQAALESTATQELIASELSDRSR